MPAAIGQTLGNDVEVIPMLRWAGSKRKQLWRLRVFWKPKHRRYIEPFVGSACLFFGIQPSTAILGDNNSSLIEFYKVVRKSPERIYRRLQSIPRNEMTYYRWRNYSPAELDPETRALRFFYLNRNCFNGIYRTNESNVFNVPYGGSPTLSIKKNVVVEGAKMLRKAKLMNGDFSKTLTKVKKDDFVYLDPPYATSSRRIFRQYSNKSFDVFDIPRFGKELRKIDSLGADFLVSYADSPEARKIASKWNAARFPVRRNIAGFSGKRRNAYELLISNMEIPKSLFNRNKVL